MYEEKKLYPELSGNHLFGICCSGGGMRSAIFNFGILRALHQLGHLKKINYISAVSGGSWAATQYILSENLNNFFDLSGDFYHNRLKNLEWKEFKRFCITSDPLGYAAELKKVCIDGLTDKDFLNTKFPNNSGKPFLILGASYSPPSGNHERFDFTKLYSGNEFSIGFHKSSDIKIHSTGEKIGLEHMIEASSAAVGFDIGEKPKGGALRCETVTGKCFNLTDGGHYENLGLEALVVRGVKNIIVCDSEYDPQPTISHGSDHDSMTEERPQKFSALRASLKHLKDCNCSFKVDLGYVEKAVMEYLAPGQYDQAIRYIPGENGGPNILYIKLRRFKNFTKYITGFPQYRTDKFHYSPQEFSLMIELAQFILKDDPYGLVQVKKFFSN